MSSTSLRVGAVAVGSLVAFAGGGWLTTSEAAASDLDGDPFDVAGEDLLFPGSDQLYAALDTTPTPEPVAPLTEPDRSAPLIAALAPAPPAEPGSTQQVPTAPTPGASTPGAPTPGDTTTEIGFALPPSIDRPFAAMTPGSPSSAIPPGNAVQVDADQPVGADPGPPSGAGERVALTGAPTTPVIPELSAGVSSPVGPASGPPAAGAPLEGDLTVEPTEFPQAIDESLFPVRGQDGAGQPASDPQISQAGDAFSTVPGTEDVLGGYRIPGTTTQSPVTTLMTAPDSPGSGGPIRSDAQAGSTGTGSAVSRALEAGEIVLAALPGAEVTDVGVLRPGPTASPALAAPSSPSEEPTLLAQAATTPDPPEESPFSIGVPGLTTPLYPTPQDNLGVWVDWLNRYKQNLSPNQPGFIGAFERDLGYGRDLNGIRAGETSNALNAALVDFRMYLNETNLLQNAGLTQQGDTNAFLTRAAGQAATNLNEATADYTTVRSLNAGGDEANRALRGQFGRATSNQAATVDRTVQSARNEGAPNYLTQEFLAAIAAKPERLRTGAELEALDYVSRLRARGASDVEVLDSLTSTFPDLVRPPSDGTVRNASGEASFFDPERVTRTFPTSRQVVMENYQTAIPQPPQFRAYDEQDAARSVQRYRTELDAPRATANVAPELRNPQYGGATSRTVPNPALTSTEAIRQTAWDNNNFLTSIELPGRVVGGITGNPVFETDISKIIANAVLYGQTVDRAYRDFLPRGNANLSSGIQLQRSNQQLTEDLLPNSGTTTGRAADSNQRNSDATIEQTRVNGQNGSANAIGRNELVIAVNAQRGEIREQYDQSVAVVEQDNAGGLNRFADAESAAGNTLGKITAWMPYLTQGEADVIQTVLDVTRTDPREVALEVLRRNLGQDVIDRMVTATVPSSAPRGSGTPAPKPADQFTPEDLRQLNEQIRRQDQER